MLTCAGSPVTVTVVPGADDVDRVVAVGAVDGHGDRPRRRRVPPASPPRSISTCVTSVPVRSLTVIVVGAAQRVELDVLDVVEVHGDVGDVAGEPHPAAVGRDVDVLGDVGAVEQQRVGAVLAFDRVAAVARIPDEGVVAGAEEGRVVAAAAVDDVVAVAAEQHVVAVAAGDGVVAGAAVDGELDQGGEAVAGGDDVVAAIGVDDEIFGGADVEGERRRADAVEAHARAVGGDGEGLGAVAAVDLGGVGAVAALDEVGVVARIPDHAVVAGLAEHLVVAVAAGQRVVAGAAEQQVVAALAEQGVVARLAEQQVVARAAGQRVVAGAAEQLRGGQRAVGFVERDHVVAALAEHLDQARCWRRSACRPTIGTAPPLTRICRPRRG